MLTDGVVPRSITVDHGTDFMSRALEDWGEGTEQADVPITVMMNWWTELE